MGLGTKLNSKLATCKAMFIGAQLKPKNKTSELSAQKLGGHVSLTFSPNKLIDLYITHQKSIDFADDLRTPATASVRAVLARAYYHENHVRLEEFISVVNSGYTITPFDEAAIALRNALLVMRDDRKIGGSLSKIVVYKKTITALSHFTANRNVRYVKEKDIELYPCPDFD
jgi:hypothetical protein